MLRRLLRSGRSRPPLPLVLYTRPGCHLCEVMKTELEAGRPGAYALTEVDIETDPELERRFGQSSPVLELGGRTAFKGRLDPNWRARFDRLAAAWWAAPSPAGGDA